MYTSDTNGYIIGDGSWTLSVYVTKFNIEKKLRVKGDLHIGGVMLKLVDILDISMDWSDHALWWPKCNKWLTRTRSTLDQYAVQADAVLHFTPMHKRIKLQLPDSRYLDCDVDFSIKTFNAVIQLCKDLGIRHAEELSLCKPLEAHHIKSNWIEENQKKNHVGRDRHAVSSPQSADTNTFIGNHSPDGSIGSLEMTYSGGLTPSRHTPVSAPVTPTGTYGKTRNGYSLTEIGIGGGNITQLEFLNGNLEQSLANSPITPSPEARSKMLIPKSLVEKARMNVAWLDSSLSIMEQGVNEHDILRLRYKFFSFYDLNPKIDAVRINMIYEQARWMLLNEEMDCTEEEALMFAALQAQVNLQTNLPQPELDVTDTKNDEDVDEISEALNDLQETLQGTQINPSYERNHEPELNEYLKFMKTKKFTLKGYKTYWFTCHNLDLRLYKNQADGAAHLPPVYIINLKGCEVTPDVNLMHNKFSIKLEVPSPEGMSEMWIRCSNEEQYARWMAACRLGAKGRALTGSTYDNEVKSIVKFLEMQRPANTTAISPSFLDISPKDYLSHRYCKKLKNKTIQRILEAHTNVKNLSLIEAKMNYIKAWQSLPDFGVSLFIVRFMNHKKDELLGIASNRIMRMDLNSGDHIKTWRYNTMKEWHVNWEIRHMMIQFEEEDISFACQSADCKVVHEFIGGYIFLSTRSKEANQTLNEELFHKLTGGWV